MTVGVRPDRTGHRPPCQPGGHTPQLFVNLTRQEGGLRRYTTDADLVASPALRVTFLLPGCRCIRKTQLLSATWHKDRRPSLPIQPHTRQLKMTISHLHAGGSQRLTEIPGHKTGPIIDRAGKIGIKMNGLQGPGTGGIISENQGVPSGEVQPVVRDAFLGAEPQKEFEIGFLVLHTVSPGQQEPDELEFGTANRFEHLLQDLQNRQVLEQPGPLDQPQTIQTGTEHHTVAVELFIPVFFGDFPDNAAEIAV